MTIEYTLSRQNCEGDCRSGGRDHCDLLKATLMARMKSPPSKTLSTLDTAAAHLRQIVLAQDEGVLLGSEETLQSALGVSRATMRQAARLLEREGLLKVKRGINGGYFGGRPDLGTIESSVSAYLQMLNVEVEDLSMVASTLWVEVVRKACMASSAEMQNICDNFRPRIRALPDNTPFTDVSNLEAEFRTALFDLLDSRYIQLIFQINVAFSFRKMAVPPSERNDTPEHTEFVRSWREAKLLEIEAISGHDPEMGALAARHSRNLLHKRIWGYRPV
jgi:GntR family transcriptional regulator, transcriptional repressor for pyruvate dehydrogenase complex